MFNQNRYKAPPLNDNKRLQTLTIGYQKYKSDITSLVTISGCYPQAEIRKCRI